MPGTGFVIPPEDDWSFKEGRGGSGAGGNLFGPGGGSAPALGVGGFYGGQGTPYDRMPPMFGYRRMPMGGTPMRAMTLAGGGLGYGRSMQPAGWSHAQQPSPGWGQAPPPAMPGLNGMGALGGASQVGGGSYGAGSPFGPMSGSDFWNLWSNYTGGGINPFNQLEGNLMGQYLNSDMLNPNGSPALLDAIRQQFARQAGTNQQGIRNQLNASGTSDPNNLAFGALMGDLKNSDQMSQAMSAAQLQSMMGNRENLQGLFNQMLQSQLNQQGYVTQKDLGASQFQNPSSGSNLGGQIASGIGSLLPYLMLGSGL